MDFIINLLSNFVFAILAKLAAVAREYIRRKRGSVVLPARPLRVLVAISRPLAAYYKIGPDGEPVPTDRLEGGFLCPHPAFEGRPGEGNLGAGS
jgi:hypothetical protein